MFMQDATRFAAALPAGALPSDLLSVPVRRGLTAATLVDSATGWRAAATLSRGDRLHSFDGGLREVVAVDRAWVLPGAGAELVLLPGGMLGNAEDLLLLPDQSLLIDTWDDDAGGGVTALVTAEALLALPGTLRHSPSGAVEVVTPVFAEEEVIHASGGLLLHCPGVAGLGTAGPDDSFYPRLSPDLARAILLRRAA